jgi:hypothetical protein
MSEPKRLMRRLFPSRFIPVLLFLFATSGCSVIGPGPGLVQSDLPTLHKRVMVSPLIDLAGVGREEAARIEGEILSLLAKSPRLTLYPAPQGLVLASNRSPDFGIVTHPELIKEANALGMNALLSCVLNPVEVTTQRTGRFPFRKTAKVYEISMVTNLSDVTRGILIMTRVETEKVTFPLDEVEGQDEKRILSEAFKKVLPSLVDRQVSAVSKRLREEPWSGRILSVEDGSVTINAGRDVGVRPGQLFHVYARGESVLCRNGKIIEVSGKKAGKIKSSSVLEDRSSATLVEGGPFTEGQLIRFIR